MEQPNRNVVVLGRSRLCEYHLGMRTSWCNRPKCEFAHRLSELDVPNETSNDRWAKVWHDGEVDIWCWNPKLRSADSKRRFQRAFAYERGHSETMVPNWAWGLATNDGLIGDDYMPKYVPRDFDWIRLQTAWGLLLPPVSCVFSLAFVCVLTP